MNHSVVRAGVVAVAAIGGLIAVDCLWGRWFRTDTTSRLHLLVPEGQVEEIVVVFPGMAMPAGAVGRAFAPYLCPNHAMVVVQYPERGLDIPEIVDQIADMIGSIKPARLRIYGASMGGMIAAEFVERLRPAHRKLGETVLVLDTAPSGPSDVRFARLLSRLAGWYRGGPISSVVWWVLCQRYPYAPKEAAVDPALVRSAHRQFARTGTPTLTSQAAYVGRFRPPSVDGQVDRAVYVRGEPAGGDPVINLDSAIDSWRTVLPGLRTVILHTRQDTWHVPIIERPQETVRMIMEA